MRSRNTARGTAAGASRVDPRSSRCSGGRSPRIRAAVNTSSASCRRPSRAADTPSSTRVSACCLGQVAQRADADDEHEATASVTSKPVTIASRPARPGMPSLMRSASQPANRHAELHASAAGRRNPALRASCGLARQHDAAARAEASTIVLTISVTSASSISNEATANAPTKLYSL